MPAAVCALSLAAGCGEDDPEPASKKQPATTTQAERKPPSPEAEVAELLKRGYREIVIGLARGESQRSQAQRYLDQVKSVETSCSATKSPKFFNCSASASMPGYAPRTEQFRVSVAGRRGSLRMTYVRPQ